jgi:hypothetical protein
MTGFVHPEMVAGRRLWLDATMRDLINKVKYGDAVLGWEGDELLDVFWNPTLECWELMRFENGDYSLVAKSKPGVVFDERIIHELARRDAKRNPNRDLAAEVEAHNDAIRDAERASFDEMIAEEIAPRMRRSMIREGII